MNLRERFKKYTPSQEMLPYMDFIVTNTKADVQNSMIEVSVEFPYLVTKETYLVTDLILCSWFHFLFVNVLKILMVKIMFFSSEISYFSTFT